MYGLTPPGEKIECHPYCESVFREELETFTTRVTSQRSTAGREHRKPRDKSDDGLQEEYLSIRCEGLKRRVHSCPSVVLGHRNQLLDRSDGVLRERRTGGYVVTSGSNEVDLPGLSSCTARQVMHNLLSERDMQEHLTTLER